MPTLFEIAGISKVVEHEGMTEVELILIDGSTVTLRMDASAVQAFAQKVAEALE